MKRFYPLILLPAVATVLFLVELFRQHGYKGVGGQLWLVLGILTFLSFPAAWVLYARWLQRFAQIDSSWALTLDLPSYLPFVLLLAYFLPGIKDTQNVGTQLFFSALALSIAFKASILFYFRRSALRSLASRPGLILGAILLLALLFRISLIASVRFHSDEALFAQWGLLIATGQDIFLQTEIVDKPPVFFYVLALFLRVFGPTETAARLPNILASLAGIAIVYELAREMFDQRAALLSALVLACSPFHIQFASTVFTDPLMVTLALGACLLALKGRYGPAGLAMGLAAMTKPTALFFFPLLLFLGMRRLPRRQWRHTVSAGVYLCSGFIVLIAAAALWDLVIRVDAPQVLDTGMSHYGGMQILSLVEAWPRLTEWLGLLQFFTGSVLLNGVLVVGLPVLLIHGLWRRDPDRRWLFDWGWPALPSTMLACTPC